MSEEQKITHPEMVRGLAKSGEAIIMELTPTAMHNLHMAVGIAGEAGEINEAVMEIHIDDIDRENMVEELGDIEFYIEGLRQGAGIVRGDTLLEKSVFCEADMGDKLEALRYESVWLMQFSCDLLDTIKKQSIYVKELDIEKLIGNLNAIEIKLYDIRTIMGISREECLAHNIAKLGERYKGHKYSNQQAHDRADKA